MILVYAAALCYLLGIVVAFAHKKGPRTGAEWLLFLVAAAGVVLFVLACLDVVQLNACLR